MSGNPLPWGFSKLILCLICVHFYTFLQTTVYTTDVGKMKVSHRVGELNCIVLNCQKLYPTVEFTFKSYTWLLWTQVQTVLCPARA